MRAYKVETAQLAMWQL